MKKSMSFILVLCILLSVILSSFASAETTEPSIMTEASDQVSTTFDEYLEQGGEDWFLTGKRQYAVQAMMVSQETSFHNELEVTDYTVTNDGITVIREFRLEAGDCLFVYTDGVPEATNAAGEMFGEERLAEALNQAADTAPETLIRTVYDAVNRFTGSAPQFDDTTMLCCRWR